MSIQLSPRAGSVFLPPVRAALLATTFAAACAADLFGPFTACPRSVAAELPCMVAADARRAAGRAPRTAFERAPPPFGVHGADDDHGA